MDDKEPVKFDDMGRMEDVDAMEAQMETDKQSATENDSPVDLTNGQTGQGGEPPGDPDEGTVDDAVNGHRLSAEKPKKDIPKEVPIEYLKSPVNGRVFAVSKDLIKRKDLVPCDEDGKKIFDSRIIGRFN